MTEKFVTWLDKVRASLASINMNLEDWQGVWRFDFDSEYTTGTDPADAAAKANRFWWYEQNKSRKQECQVTKNCWLPQGHSGNCEQVS